MAEPKTRPTGEAVTAFLGRVSDEGRRKDCFTLVELMRNATRAEPEMWGSSIVGFGRYRYRYASGREGEWMVMGFSPRKQDLTLYVLPGLDRFAPLLSRLGRHTTGKSCLYVKRLADLDLAVLRELLAEATAAMAEQRVDG
ncbi:MAG: DUF1801 domain-containing protein [Thermoanaerobaculaceae bacterium]